MKRLFIIFLFTLLLGATIGVWSYSYFESHEEATIETSRISEYSTIPSESGMFERSGFAMEYAIMPLDQEYQRDLKNYYDNRAFYGAPPTVPHPIEEGGIGSNACLKCHENGGFVEEFQAYTPVTPHPDKANCVQCHVRVKSKSFFVPSTWVRNKPPAIGNQALEGSPPIVPHPLQLRENCLSCHAGPSAVKEIRTSHPERINCRQCHVINEKKSADIGTFKREIK